MEAKAPRHRRRSRTRIAYYATRTRQARTAAERYDVAAAAVQSAVKHARRGRDRHARALRDELARQAGELLARAGAPQRRVRLYRAKLAAPGSEPQRLGQALMCLKGACKQLPAPDRDAYLDHYARHLTDRARRIEHDNHERR